MGKLFKKYDPVTKRWMLGGVEETDVITIADGDNWPPPFIGTFQIEDNDGKYNIGDYYATEMSEALRRARQQQQERERSNAAD